MSKKRVPVSERIETIITKLCGGNASRFARQIGITPMTASRWRRGETPPAEDERETICHVFGCNRQWLDGYDVHSGLEWYTVGLDRETTTLPPKSLAELGAEFEVLRAQLQEIMEKIKVYDATIAEMRTQPVRIRVHPDDIATIAYEINQGYKDLLKKEFGDALSAATPPAPVKPTKKKASGAGSKSGEGVDR